VKRNVVLLGIDGADWAFLDDWIESGAMPNIAALVKNGVRAPLDSVMPLNSAAAWVSIITGRSPGGHGIFGFTRCGQGGYVRRPVSTDDIGAATLWDAVNAAGEPLGVVNCPITYPPPELDGFAISGILVSHNDLWAHPPELEAELRGLFGPYMVDVAWALVDDAGPGEREKFLADMYLMARKQEEVALKCMATRPWSVLAVFFTGTDRIMHRLWHYIDRRHPLHDSDAAKIFGDEIRKYYVLIDDIIGRILEKAGDASVIVASDHGFGALYHRFYLRRWLAERDYLVEDASIESVETDEALCGIDLSASKTFPASLSESGLWINLKGRQAQGMVDANEYDELRVRIIRELEGFEAEDGSKPVKRAVRREDVLAGPFVDEAPDILIEPNDLFIVDDAPSEEVIKLSMRETGTHRPSGIFMASGPGFERGATLSRLNSVDILPTLLAAAGLPVPEGIEGRVVEEAFDEPPRVIHSPPISPRRQRKKPDSLEEDKKKKNLLKGLGYL